jgi:hypothetical protein
MPFAAAGLLWGVLGYFLGERGFRTMIWGGALASPLIGILVGRFIHPRFVDSSGAMRVFIALISLLAASILFGLAMGITDLVLGHPGRRAVEVVLQPVIGVLWGVTIGGFFIALWPLAYATHYFLEFTIQESEETPGLSR